ncbi:hypothetical protein HK098_000500 [Nowakowskiella sp. JEL0407]|nr:hypothetical protein HK098_000500 [Nowakowskiella sp. JEL0407]
MQTLLNHQGSYSFTEEEIMSKMFGFFLAGHDSTTNTLTWSALELANHPEVVKKLRKEIDLVFQPGTEPTFEMLSILKYVEAFVKEVLRIYPVVLIDGRESNQDMEITTSDGLKIALPKGIQVNVHIGRIHQSEKYWEKMRKSSTRTGGFRMMASLSRFPAHTFHFVSLKKIVYWMTVMIVINSFKRGWTPQLHWPKDCDG